MSNNVKEAYRLCWFCNLKFRGNLKTPIEISTPQGFKIVYAHKQCIKEQEENGK